MTSRPGTINRPAAGTAEATEKERLEPGSTPQRTPQPQPPRARQRNKAALPGSQNEDLKGPKPNRGPRGAST
jgi:hypothetical protein